MNVYLFNKVSYIKLFNVLLYSPYWYQSGVVGDKRYPAGVAMEGKGGVEMTHTSGLNEMYKIEWLLHLLEKTSYWPRKKEKSWDLIWLTWYSYTPKKSWFHRPISWNFFLLGICYCTSVRRCGLPWIPRCSFLLLTFSSCRSDIQIFSCDVRTQSR